MAKYTDIDDVQERIVELENMLADTSVMPNLMQTEFEDELQELSDFIAVVTENGNCVELVNAMMFHYSYDEDNLELVQSIIHERNYSTYENVEEYGKMMVDYSDARIPDWMEYYIDFEGLGEMSLQGESDYFTMVDGTVVTITG